MKDSVMKLIINLMDDMGYILFEEPDSDFDLRNYIIDSVQFIQFIINIEQEIGIELPDDFLLYDMLSSYVGFCNAIVDFLNEKKIIELKGATIS